MAYCTNIPQFISEFNCIVEGYFGPGRPTVEWRRAGGGGGHSGRVIAGRLTFGRVAKSDEGEYLCSVTSADGRRTQEARTMLYVRDRGVFEPRSISYLNEWVEKFFFKWNQVQFYIWN